MIHETIANSMPEIYVSSGKYITQAFPTFFHTFHSRRFLIDDERASDFMEVDEGDVASIRAADAEFVRPPRLFVDKWNLQYGSYNISTGYFERGDRKDIPYSEALEIVKKIDESQLASKVDAAPGMGLSSNDFTDALKEDVEQWHDWHGTQFTETGRVETSGVLSDMSQYRRTPMLPLNRECPLRAHVGGHVSVYGISLFDATGRFLKGANFSGENLAWCDVEISPDDMPEDAALFVVSSHISRTTGATYSNGATQESREGAAANAMAEAGKWRNTYYARSGIMSHNGTVNENAGYVHSELIPINRDYPIVVHGQATLHVGAVIFFGAGMNVVGSSMYHGSTMETITVEPKDIPAEAVYFVANSSKTARDEQGSYWMHVPNLESMHGAISAAIMASKVGLFDDMFAKLAGNYGKIDHTHMENGAPAPYYLNELWLTYDEAQAVVAAGPLTFPYPSAFYGKARTNLVSPGADNVGCANDRRPDIAQLFRGCSSIEVIRMGADNANYPVNASSIYLFATGCVKLRKILGIINVGSLGTQAYSSNRDAFANCALLEEVRLKNLKIDYNFKDCPLLSLASLQYLVTNAANGSTAITVTVHADVYAKLTGDTTNGAASALSADELAQWTALLTTAANKNIAFATV